MIVAKIDRAVHRVVGRPDAKVKALAALLEQPEDLDELVALGAMSDDLVRMAAGLIHTITPKDRYRGPHATMVMLPFALPSNSRFSDGSTYGVWYAGDTLKTAAIERGYHFQRWLSLTPTPPQLLEQTSITARIRGQLHDIRQQHTYVPRGIYASDSYAASQSYGHDLRGQGSEGLYYSSVRASGAECFGLFRPAAVVNVELAVPIYYQWDGSSALALRTL